MSDFEDDFEEILMYREISKVMKINCPHCDGHYYDFYMDGKGKRRINLSSCVKSELEYSKIVHKLYTEKMRNGKADIEEIEYHEFYKNKINELKKLLKKKEK